MPLIKDGCQSGKINQQFIKQHAGNLRKHFYICGPDAMVQEIVETLKRIGANTHTVLFGK